jgi:hypothetical protein
MARPLATDLDLPLIGKDLIKEALFDALGTGDRAWSRRLGVASYEVLYAVAGRSRPCSRRQLRARSRAPAARPGRPPDRGVLPLPGRRGRAPVHRRAPHRHPGHVDHQLAPEIRATLARGVGPLRLGGPVLEVDTARPVGRRPGRRLGPGQRAAAP